MQASAGNLDGLVGFSFAAEQFLDVTVTSFAQDANGNVLDVLTQVVSAPSALAALDTTPASYTIGAIADTADQIEIDQYSGSSATFAQTLTYTVLAYNEGALLVSPMSLSQLVAAIQDGESVAGQIGAIAAGTLPDDTNVRFSPNGVFLNDLACFALGTRILTARGEVPVERLRVGARVPGQVSGRLRRVRWIGRRTIEVARSARPWDVAPVRIQAHAFAPNRPHRDLLLSPDHAVLVEGALIPVRYLLNGATIRQEFPPVVTYLHVELDAHDVLLAENLPCESYLDTGNRAALLPAGAPTGLRGRPWRPSAPVIGTQAALQHGGPG